MVQAGKVKEVECVVFVPSTHGSRLRDILQEKDDQISTMMNSPALRFVEKGGETVVERVGRAILGKGRHSAPGRIVSTSREG